MTAFRVYCVGVSLFAAACFAFTGTMGEIASQQQQEPGNYSPVRGDAEAGGIQADTDSLDKHEVQDVAHQTWMDGFRMAWTLLSDRNLARLIVVNFADVCAVPCAAAPC